MGITERIRQNNEQYQPTLLAQQETVRLEDERKRQFIEKLLGRLQEYKKMIEDSKLVEIMDELVQSVPGFSYRFVANIPYKYAYNSETEWRMVKIIPFNNDPVSVSEIRIPGSFFDTECLNLVYVSCDNKWVNRDKSGDAKILIGFKISSAFLDSPPDRDIQFRNKLLPEKVWGNTKALEDAVFEEYVVQDTYSHPPREQYDPNTAW